MTAAGERIERESVGLPFGVVVIAVIQVVRAVYSAGLLLRADLSMDYVRETGYIDLASLVLDVFCVAIAGGLLQLHRWAWVLIMFVLAVDMSFGLWRYYEGSPSYVRMALNVVAIFYLNSRDVRHAFGHTRSAEELAVRG